jgi:two-component system, sporulation sensor kinase D
LSIYSKKETWKKILVLLAFVIVGLSIWYTNILVSQIASEERQKVKLWAEAIQNKAKLVKYTNEIFNRVKREERRRIEIWAEATKMLVKTENDIDRNFYLNIVKGNKSIPVILTNEKKEIISWQNVAGVVNETKSKLTEEEMVILNDLFEKISKDQLPIEIPYYKDYKNYLYYTDSKLFEELKSVLEDLVREFINEIVLNSATAPVIYTDSTQRNILAYGLIDSLTVSDSMEIIKRINVMKSQNNPIEIEIDEGEKHYIFYENSLLLTQLKYLPYVQIIIIGLFLFVAYSLFSTARRAEQNQVWVGLAKETAHQLGTPLSSLMAWTEILKLENIDPKTLVEIEKDISRLNIVTDRFSKIGAIPVLKPTNLVSEVNEVVEYFKVRISQKISIVFNSNTQEVSVPLSSSLFQWVIENLIKNAIDAMDGKGSIVVSISEEKNKVNIDIEDTGKGVPKSSLKTIFEPGYTTKNRGWGLGLSLAKRIVENYHNGKIFVKKSEIGKGTTFRIILNKV